LSCEGHDFQGQKKKYVTISKLQKIKEFLNLLSLNESSLELLSGHY
jgi:hypothetical protein